jgi:hypothetical protein
MARALHADACRDHALVAWIIMQDPPDYPGKFTARLATRGPLPYVLIGETLAEVQEQLPPGLVRGVVGRSSREQRSQKPLPYVDQVNTACHAAA